MICDKCKSILPDDSEYCQYCGKKIKSSFETDESKFSLSSADEKPAERTKADIFGWEILRKDPQKSTPNIEDHKIVVTNETTNAQEETREEPIVAVESTAPKKQEKIKPDKYCSRCGNKIDHITKKCTGCGKQYFRGFKFNKFSITVIALVVLLLISFGFNVLQILDRNDVASQRDKWIDKADTLQKRVSTLSSQALENRQIADFVDKYVVFIEDDGSNVYHKFECYRFKREQFYVLNIEWAEVDGYTPCDRCH